MSRFQDALNKERYTNVFYPEQLFLSVLFGSTIMFPNFTSIQFVHLTGLQIIISVLTIFLVGLLFAGHIQEYKNNKLTKLDERELYEALLVDRIALRVMNFGIWAYVIVYPEYWILLLILAIAALARVWKRYQLEV